MKENSRIRFNPVTREIEIEGSEAFVKDYFNKLKAMLAGPGDAAAAPRPPRRSTGVGPATKRTAPSKAEKRQGAPKPRRQKPSGRPAGNKVTHLDRVIGIVRQSATGISTTELIEKTGLSKNQLWSIVNRAAKAGKIQKLKRGLYGVGVTTP